MGDRVLLHPRQGGEVLDVALAGQVAHIESIEQDYEGKVHVCVVPASDPGRDLGLLRQPGHRFFFDPEELEPLPPEQARPRTNTSRFVVFGAGKHYCGGQRHRSGGHLPAAVDCSGSTGGHCGRHFHQRRFEQHHHGAGRGPQAQYADGGEILRRGLADFPVVVGCDYIPRIQEVQASNYHIIRELVEVLGSGNA